MLAPRGWKGLKTQGLRHFFSSNHLSVVRQEVFAISADRRVVPDTTGRWSEPRLGIPALWSINLKQAR